MDNDLIQDTNLDLLQVQVADVEYSGIAPINVDNQEHTISLDPSALSSKLDTSAFDEWTATHSAGQEYSAGNGIDITDHVISVTGQLTGDYLTKASADTLYQPIGDYLTTADSGNFYPMEGNPSGFLTGVDLTDYYKKNETSSKEEIANALTAIDNTISGLTGEFQEKGDYYSASNPSGFITGVDLSNYYQKNETSSKQEIGDVITEINNNITNLSGKYYPLNSNPSGYLTAHQDITDKLDVTAFTAYTATAQGTEYSAGDNINITNHVISGKDWSSEIENATTGKLDASAFNSGDFYPMTGNPSGFITGVDLTPYQEKTGMTAYQSAGDYYSASNPSGFITGVDLSNYYEKNETSSKEELSAALSGLTAETIDLSAGEGISIVESADKVVISCTATGAGFDPTYISAQIDNKLDKSESANYYPMTGNPSGFLTAHQSLTNYYTKTDIQNQSGNYYPMTGNPSGFLTAHQSLSNYYTKNDTSSKQQISAALADAGHEYTGIAPIGVNNNTYQISAETWSLSAGDGLRLTEDAISKVATLSITGGAGGGSTIKWYTDTPAEHTSADIDLVIQTTATLGGSYDRNLLDGNGNFIGALIPSAGNGDLGKVLTITAGSPRWQDLPETPSGAYGIKTEVVANSGLATGQNILYIVTGV